MNLKVEKLDLHGLNRQEAVQKTQKNLDWLLKQGVDVLVVTHGRGHHSDGIAVLKTEIRKLLREDQRLAAAGYRIVPGESELPVALGMDEGSVLVVRRGCEHDYLGGRREQDRNKIVFSAEGRQQRKAAKKRRK